MQIWVKRKRTLIAQNPVSDNNHQNLHFSQNTSQGPFRLNYTTSSNFKKFKKKAQNC